MKLDDHLRDAGLSNADFGRQVEASEATISRLRNRKQTPSLALMLRIEAATAGAVTPNDFAVAPARPWAEPDIERSFADDGLKKAGSVA